MIKVNNKFGRFTYSLTITRVLELPLNIQKVLELKKIMVFFEAFRHMLRQYDHFLLHVDA
jgi:hypothetical protein